MKRLILFLVLFTTINLTKAQAWFPLGSGLNCCVYAMDTLNGELYSDGDYFLDSSSPVHFYFGLALGWKGAAWDTITGGNWWFWVKAINHYNGHLYFGVNQYGVQEWNGTTLVTEPSMYNGIGGSMVNYNGKLYAGGSFTLNNYSGSVVALNDSVWDSVGVSPNSFVSALATYNGTLFAGGSFNKSGSITTNHVAVWNDTVWTSLGSGINGVVNALAVYNGNLYAAGTFDSAGGIPTQNIAMWNGSGWSALGNGVGDSKSSVNALTVFNGSLIVGGSFSLVNGMNANNIAQWNGIVWDSLGSGTNGAINALIPYNNFLCAGGSFTIAGGIAANSIAGWCNGCPAGINELSNDNLVTVFPNPSKGVFTIKVDNEQLTMNNEKIEVYNMLGEKILASSLNLSKGGTYSIDLSNQSEGMYLYRMLDNSGKLITSGKLIIQ